MNRLFVTFSLAIFASCTATNGRQLQRARPDVTAAFGGHDLALGSDASDLSPAADQRSPATTADAAPLSIAYDVVVVGAGSGGCAAAIQAARLGASVLLLEPTDYIGGQMTAAAVSMMDGGTLRPAGTGVYAEFRRAVIDVYRSAGKSTSTCYWSATSTCFEPRVGKRVLQEMLTRAGVTLKLNARPAAVSKTANRVTGLTLADGHHIASKLLIDATEYGDVLPLAGANYRVANRTDNAIDPAACIQHLTYVAVVKKYPDGIPDELQLQQPPPGYDVARQIFAKFLSLDGSASTQDPPVRWDYYSAYRGLPDSSNPVSYASPDWSNGAITKTGLNWANDYPGHHAGGQLMHKAVTAAYLEDEDLRQEVNCQAKLLTLNHVYYLQHELGLPWSVANDEGYDTPYNRAHACSAIPASFKTIERHMPPIPYVRESRRIVATQTLTARELMPAADARWSATNFRTSIAVGDYGTDLHGCGVYESELGESSAHRSSGPRTFQVPLGALIPVDVDGLIAAEKNIGVSRLANGATRLQPITMATGQAAGALAALAVDGNKQPRQVDPLDVQRTLLRAGSGLARQHYSDVPPDSPLWPDVQLVATHELMVGQVGRFRPAAALTRETAAIVLARRLNVDLNQTPTTPTFSDVAPARGGFAAIEALVAKGIVGGCATTPKRRYCPEQAITRAELALLAYRALRLPPAADTAQFSDVSTYAAQIRAASPLFEPCGTMRFCPQDPATRGDAATLLARSLGIQPR